MNFHDILMVAATQTIGGAAAPSAPINATDTNGWSATAPVVNPGDSFTVQGAGYDSTGSVTTISRTVTVTKQLRRVYPLSASLEPNKVALSDYIRSTDTTTAFPGTTAVTPTPIIAYTDTPTGTQVVGNTVSAECFVDHWDFRNGKPVPCVEFIWSDGVNSVSAKATTPQVLGGTYDLNAVIGYKVTGVDISALTNGAITLNVKAYPWVGGPASIADSSSGTIGARGVVPRQYVKNPTLAATPYYAYYNPGVGNDTTGVASTNPATARATPCLTPQGALNKLRAAAGDNGGGIIRQMAGTHLLTVSPAATASATQAEVIIEADPLASPGTVILQFGTNNVNLQQKYIRWRNMTIQRATNTFSLSSTVGGAQLFENCTIDFASGSAALTNVPNSLIGCTFQNWTAGSFSPTATYGVWLVRGGSLSPLVPTTQQAIDHQWVFGCNLTNMQLTYPSTIRSNPGAVVHGVRAIGCSGANQFINIGSGNAADTSCFNVSISNVTMEWIGNNAAVPGIGISRDPTCLTNLNHVLITNVTLPSGYNAGRSNIFYDNNNGTVVRTHAFCKLYASIVGQVNIKEDYFVGTDGGGTPDPTNAPLHIGNWSCLYGVGWGYNLFEYINAQGTNTLPAAFANEYAGVGTQGPAGVLTATRTDPKFTVDGVTTVTAGPTYTAGTGSSNFVPQSTSPCKAAVVTPLWPFDMTGAATNSTIGALNAA